MKRELELGTMVINKKGSTGRVDTSWADNPPKGKIWISYGGGSYGWEHPSDLTILTEKLRKSIIALIKNLEKHPNLITHGRILEKATLPKLIIY